MLLQGCSFFTLLSTFCLKIHLTVLFSHMRCQRQASLRMASFKCSILKVFGTDLNYSFSWNGLLCYLFSSLVVVQVRASKVMSCKWLAFDMILHTLFTYVKNSLWSHTMPGSGTFAHMASLKCSILKVFRTYLLILSFESFDIMWFV